VMDRGRTVGEIAIDLSRPRAATLRAQPVYAAQGARVRQALEHALERHTGEVTA